MLQGEEDMDQRGVSSNGQAFGLLPYGLKFKLPHGTYLAIW